jgi:membrane protease YdiL (CAAX protease family)
MIAVRRWIRKRPVVAFYVLCYAISWLLWLPFMLSGVELTQLLAVIGLFGPALACVIVSRGAAFPDSGSRPFPFWLSFIAAWILSTLAFSLNSFTNSSNPSPVALVIFAMFALLPAYILASAVSGSPGVRRTLSSLVRPGGGWAWYLLALALPVVLRLVSVWLSRQIGWELLSEPQTSSSPLELAGSVLVIFLYTLIYAGGLNEETGWTGFALPRLLAKLNPLAATILVWALWMVWHIPLYLSGDFNLSPHVLLGSFFGRFLLTWLFMRSSGGVLTAVLLHTSVNVTSQFVPLTNASLLVDAAVTLLVIIGGKMWQRLPEESSAVLAEQPVSA